VDIVQDIVFVRTVPLFQDYNTLREMDLVKAEDPNQTTTVTWIIMKGIEIDEIDTVEADHRTTGAAEATETITTTKEGILETEIVVTTMTTVVVGLGAVAEIVTEEAAGTERKGADRPEIDRVTDREIVQEKDLGTETGRDPVDGQEVVLLEDPGVDQGIDVIAGIETVVASDAAQVLSTMAPGTRTPQVLAREEEARVQMRQGEEITDQMEELRSPGSDVVAAEAVAEVARGAERAGRRKGVLGVEVAALLPVLRVHQENKNWIDHLKRVEILDYVGLQRFGGTAKIWLDMIYHIAMDGIFVCAFINLRSKMDERTIFPCCMLMNSCNRCI
jgi:hypothetical protein